jgi:hypothetical protein
MAWRKCIKRCSPDCEKIKHIQPFNTISEYPWICDACADPEQRREVRRKERRKIRVITFRSRT